MNLLLLEPDELASDGTARVGGRRATHLREVLRAGPGARIPAGLLGGDMGEAELRSWDGEEALLAVRLSRPPPPPSPVSLLLALPRPKALRRLFQTVAAAGVKRAVVVGAWRVERSYWASPRLDPEAVGRELRLGLEQGRDTVLPELLLRPHLEPFLEEELGAPEPGTARILAHERSAAPIETLPRGGARRALLAVGPEGGFSPREITLLASRGFAPFSLGPRALRVEAAVPFALGQAELWLRGAP